MFSLQLRYVLRCFLFVAIVFFSVDSSAQKTVAGLDERLKNVLDISNLPGFAVAIVKEDQIRFSGGYGFADKKKKSPFTAETIQPTGSVSKTIIALALLQCIDKNYFTLETPVNDILPFKIINPYFPNAVIRIKHLTSHTSGLIDNKATYLKTFTAAKSSATEIKDFLKSYYTPGGSSFDSSNFSKSEPGKKYNYTNIASALAAYIVEIKAGMSFGTFCEKNIFSPLKMQDTHWIYDEKKSNKYASLYEVDKQYDPIFQSLLNSDGSLKTYSSAVWPANGLRSSINDLSKYLMAMIKIYHGKSDLLSKKSLETLFKKQFSSTDMPASMDPKEPNKAIFWGYDRRGKIGTVGTGFGFATFMSFDPATGTGRIILMNTDLDGSDNVHTIESVMNLLKSLDVFEQGK